MVSLLVTCHLSIATEADQSSNLDLHGLIQGGMKDLIFGGLWLTD